MSPASPTAVPLRSPDTVMCLERLGAMHPTRLSFSRAMLRRVEAEGWRVSRPVWNIDPDGYGRAVYRVDTPQRRYSLVAFSQALAPEQRTDRVIATAWDATFALFDGVPDAGDLDRLAGEVPRQEAGRFGETELILSRANRSVRLFGAVMAALAAGRQPEAATLDAVGYLMRTTAVYGNGKFGIADRDLLAERPEFAGPFRAEMLTVWLIRAFTVDLVDHCAAVRSPATAVRLAPELRRRLGVGNSTGLGMAPFLVRHPLLLNAWMVARETALARVRSLPTVARPAWVAFGAALADAREDAAGWTTQDAEQARRIEALRRDLDRLASRAEAGPPESWNALFRWVEDHCGLEAQEVAVGLLIEPHGALVDALADTMSADEGRGAAIQGGMSAGVLRELLARHYGWALGTDYAHAAAQARFWYVSAEKLEPRLGERADEPGHELEQPLAIARDAARLDAVLARVPPDMAVAALLLEHPEHRHVVRRVQAAEHAPYAEVRGNLVDAAMRPIDLLRCKLAFFGAARFDPRSDRWLRISLFAGAPFPDEIAAGRQPATAAA